MVGAVHTLWRLPLFWMEGTNQMAYGFGLDFIIFIGLVMASSIYSTWCYLENGHSTLAVTLLHASFNLSLDCFVVAGSPFQRLSSLGIIVLAGILALIWVIRPAEPVRWKQQRVSHAERI